MAQHVILNAQNKENLNKVESLEVKNKWLTGQNEIYLNKVNEKDEKIEKMESDFKYLKDDFSAKFTDVSKKVRTKFLSFPLQW